MALVYYGEFDAASDLTTAANIRRTASHAQIAVQEQIQPVAAGIITADATLGAAAAQRVEQEVADKLLVSGARITDDSVEFVDTNGIAFLAVDDISTAPRFRGGASGGAAEFTETHLIVAAGQSNSVGIGSPVPVGTNPVLGNLFSVPQRGAQAGQIVHATDPLAHPWNDPVVGNRGHAVRFGQLYAAAHPGVRVVIVPVAASGTGFFPTSPGFSWAPSLEGTAGYTSLYRSAITRVNEAAAMFTGTVRVGAVLWHQGESDSVWGISEAQYATELDALITGFRSGMTGGADAPFIVGQMAWEFRNVRQEGTYAAINAAHVATPTRITRAGFAAAPGQGYAAGDNTHFNGRGQWLLADSYWAAWQAALWN